MSTAQAAAAEQPESAAEPAAEAPELDTPVASELSEPDGELRCTLCGLRACWTS